MKRHWRLWMDEDDGPVQWPTREPVRPKLREDGEGWRWRQVGRRETWPQAGDWAAGAALVTVAILLWVLGALLGG